MEWFFHQLMSMPFSRLRHTCLTDGPMNEFPLGVLSAELRAWRKNHLVIRIGMHCHIGEIQHGIADGGAIEKLMVASM